MDLGLRSGGTSGAPAVPDWQAYEVVSGPGPIRLAMAPEAPFAPGANDDAIAAFVLAIVGLIAAPIVMFSAVALIYAGHGLKRASLLEASGFYPSGRSLSGSAIGMAVLGLTAAGFAWLTFVLLVTGMVSLQ